MTDNLFTRPTYSVADLAGLLVGILADEPYDLDEDQAVRALNDAFDADPTGPFDGMLSGFVYMITRHPAYTEDVRNELIATVHDGIAELYEED